MRKQSALALLLSASLALAPVMPAGAAEMDDGSTAGQIERTVSGGELGSTLIAPSIYQIMNHQVTLYAAVEGAAGYRYMLFHASTQEEETEENLIKLVDSEELTVDFSGALQSYFDNLGLYDSQPVRIRVHSYAEQDGEKILSESFTDQSFSYRNVPQAPTVTWDGKLAYISNESKNINQYRYTLYVKNEQFSDTSEYGKEVTAGNIAGDATVLDLSDYMMVAGTYTLRIFAEVGAIPGPNGQVYYTVNSKHTFSSTEYEGDPVVDPAEGLAVPEILSYSNDMNFELTYKAPNYDRDNYTNYIRMELVYEYEVLGDSILASRLYKMDSRSGSTDSLDCPTFKVYFGESGIYKVRARAYSCKVEDNSSYYSDWVDVGSFEYTRPAEELGTTVAVWSDSDLGAFTAEEVPEAESYYIRLYAVDGNGAGGDRLLFTYINYYTGTSDDSGWASISKYVQKQIMEYGEGQFYITIRANSSDPTVIANGRDGEKSAILDTRVSNADVADALDSVLADESLSVDEKVEALKESLNAGENLSAIQNAMQTSDDILEKVAQLESQITDVTTEKAVDSAVESQYGIKADEIKMVGAAFSGNSGDTVSLNVTKAEKPSGVSTGQYKSVIPLEINLTNSSGRVDKLTMPLTITMPAPAGMDIHKLRIIHVHQNGTKELLYPRLTEDGMLMFTVKEFSIFLFVEEGDGTGEGEGNNTENNDGEEASDDTADSWDSSVDWAQVISTVGSAKAGENVHVLVGSSAVVPTAVLDNVKNKNVVLALQTGKGATFTIQAADLKASGFNGDLNLSFTQYSASPEAIAEKTAGTVGSKRFMLGSQGGLGVKIDAHVSFGAGMADKYANLYAYNGGTGKYDYRGSAKLNANGQAMFALTSGGDFLVTVTNEKSTETVVPGGSLNVGNGGYVVVSGDTLWSIAMRNGMSLKALIAKNPQITNPDVIRVGQVINL